MILNPDNLADSLVDMVLHLEQPYAGGLPSWPLFQKIAKDYKVAIVGSGGDEIFGGYVRYMPIAQEYNLKKKFSKFTRSCKTKKYPRFYKLKSICGF